MKTLKMLTLAETWPLKFYYKFLDPWYQHIVVLLIVQDQPLQVVPFSQFTHELSLSYPTYSRNILLLFL